MMWTKLQELIKSALCGSTLELSPGSYSNRRLRRCLLLTARSLDCIILPDRLPRPDSKNEILVLGRPRTCSRLRSLLSI